MTHEKYLELFDRLCKDIYELTSKKNSDYAGDEDAFKNFYLISQMSKIKVEEGILVRMTDKLSRVANLLGNRIICITSESIEDTLKDLAVYSLIMILYLREKANAESVPAQSDHLD